MGKVYKPRSGGVLLISDEHRNVLARLTLHPAQRWCAEPERSSDNMWLTNGCASVIVSRLELERSFKEVGS